ASGFNDEWCTDALLRNISLPFFRKIWLLRAIPAQSEGRRDRHGRGPASGGRAKVARRAAEARTQKSCGPGLPTLRPSSRDRIYASDGGKKARSPRRARRTALKPSRRECRLTG